MALTNDWVICSRIDAKSSLLIDGVAAVKVSVNVVKVVAGVDEEVADALVGQERDQVGGRLARAVGNCHGNHEITHVNH